MTTTTPGGMEQAIREKIAVHPHRLLLIDKARQQDALVRALTEALERVQREAMLGHYHGQFAHCLPCAVDAALQRAKEGA